MITPYRVLVTGSRDWAGARYHTWRNGRKSLIADAHAVRVTDALNHEQFFAEATGRPMIVVHGACSTGADLIANDWAMRNDVVVEPYPAQWKRYGRGAGPRRNQAMVQAGADICLAFPRGASPGTMNCIALAKMAGIPVVVRRYDDDSSMEDA